MTTAARRRGHRARRHRPQRARHRGVLGGDAARRAAASAGSPGSTRRPTRRGWPARCPGFDAGRPPAEPAAAADRPDDPAGPGRRRLGAGRRRRRPRRAARATTWAWSPPARPAASSSASASCRSCGAKGGQYVSAYQSFAWFYAVNTGQISIRQRHARARAACWSPTRPAAWTRSPRPAGMIRKGTPADGHRRRRRRRCARGAGSPSWPTGRLSTADDPDAAPTCRSTPQAARLRARRGRRDPGPGGRRPRPGPAARQVYGEIAGYAATFDPPPGSGRPTGLGRAAELALADAGRRPRPTSTWSSPTRPACPAADAERGRGDPRGLRRRAACR